MKIKIIKLSNIAKHQNLSMSTKDYICENSVIDVKRQNKNNDKNVKGDKK